MRDVTGYLSIGDYKIWYRRIGGEQANQPPLLILHGGPGVPQNYLSNLAELASDEREVIFYDQLGCGNSDQPDDISLWRLERFGTELGQLIEGLGLEKVVILGQSWGGMLAMEYALTQPGTIAGLILANTTSSIKNWIAEANRLREDLPPEVQAILLKHEEAETTDSAEYQEAMLVFYERHVCRVIWPDYVAYSVEHIGTPVYYIMNDLSKKITVDVKGEILELKNTINTMVDQLNAFATVKIVEVDEAHAEWQHGRLRSGLLAKRLNALGDCLQHHAPIRGNPLHPLSEHF